MTETAPETVASGLKPAEPAVERTLALFADRRAASLLLVETVSQLIATLQVRRGLIDLSSIPGLTIAAAFVKAGVPYESLEFGQERTHETVIEDPDPLQYPITAADAHRLRSHAAGERRIEITELGGIDANLALVPAVVGPNERLIDLSPQVIPGVVMEQAGTMGRDLILIDAPERGLSVDSSGVYLRTVIHVAGSKDAG